MGNLKKSFETQKAINDAVQKIFEHFKDDVSYAETLETMADATADLMEILETNRYIAENPALSINSVPTNQIIAFFHEANTAYKLLRPFAKMLGQVYGSEE